MPPMKVISVLGDSLKNAVASSKVFFEEGDDKPIRRYWIELY